MARLASLARHIVLALVCGCRSTAPDSDPSAPTAASGALARAAEAYVRLALAFDLHEPGYVDRGNYESVIEINRDLPITIDRALDIGCHEGYPGHHAQNVLVEQHVVRDRDWVEFSVLTMFSPQAFLAEAAASYAIELAFPADERLAFERDILFPLAGLDPREAAAFYAIQRLVDRLGAATVEGARRYLDGALDAGGLTRWLGRFAAMPGADDMRPFLERYRRHVVSYTFGKDLVRRYVEEEEQGAADHTLDARWERFRRLSVSPLLPSDLVK